MALYARSLRDLGERVERRARGRSPPSPTRPAGRRSRWPAASAQLAVLRRRSRYDELTVPFLKRAQIAAADLQRAGVVALPRPRAG